MLINLQTIMARLVSHKQLTNYNTLFDFGKNLKKPVLDQFQPLFSIKSVKNQAYDMYM